MPAAGTDRCITAPRMAEVFLRSFTTAFGRSCRGQLSMRKGEMRVSGLLIVLYSEQRDTLSVGIWLLFCPLLQQAGEGSSEVSRAAAASRAHPPALFAGVVAVAAVVAGALEGGQARRALAAEVPAPPAQHAARLLHVRVVIVMRAAALRSARQHGHQSRGLL